MYIYHIIIFILLLFKTKIPMFFLGNTTSFASNIENSCKTLRIFVLFPWNCYEQLSCDACLYGNRYKALRIWGKFFLWLWNMEQWRKLTEEKDEVGEKQRSQLINKKLSQGVVWMCIKAISWPLNSSQNAVTTKIW